MNLVRNTCSQPCSIMEAMGWSADAICAVEMLQYMPMVTGSLWRRVMVGVVSVISAPSACHSSSGLALPKKPCHWPCSPGSTVIISSALSISVSHMMERAMSTTVPVAAPAEVAT